MRLLLLGVVFGLSACSADQERSTTRVLSVSGHRIVAEVAITAEKQEQGLKKRNFLGANQGMLFVLRRPSDVCTWMKDTAIPLSVAFLDDRGLIINIADMVPETDHEYCAERPASFVLEVRQGWFNKNAVGIGALVRGMGSVDG